VSIKPPNILPNDILLFIKIQKQIYKITFE
jgi:hypothetical protein